MAACGFDMRFTYVLPGWEGTASDSRIIKNALVRDDKLLIPRGTIYKSYQNCSLYLKKIKAMTRLNFNFVDRKILLG